MIKTKQNLEIISIITEKTQQGFGGNKRKLLKEMYLVKCEIVEK